MKKRGQMQLSFGMIFSIILIIVFIAFAFYVIKILIEGQEEATVLLFKEDLEEDIEKIWKGSGSITKPEGYKLTKKIEMVCFVDYSSPEKGENSEIYRKLKQVYYEYENMFFYPVGSGAGLDATTIRHIDLEKMTESENPYCIENKDGRIILTIKKGYNEELVLVER